MPARSKPEDNGLKGPDRSAGVPAFPKTVTRPLRAKAGANLSQMHYARRGIITPEMEYVAVAREPGPRNAERIQPRRAGLGRRHPRLRDARIRPRRSCPRPGDHSQQRQSPRMRADGDRAQLPGQDQRQHRQLGGRVRRRQRGRQDGLVDPLGRGHRHGPQHRPQHPRHARMDHPQQPRADRHRADLSGAGESWRRRRGPDLGDLPRHADRTGRAGRRLFHHPRRRAPALYPDDRQARDRHRQPGRLDHGQVVPVPPQGELPLRALRRDHRDLQSLRRRLFAGRRACAPGPSPTPTTKRSSPNCTRWAS